jgi:L-serine dehydratase
MIEYEMSESGRTQAQVFFQMKEYYLVMKEAVLQGLERVNAYLSSSESSSGETACRAMSYALAESEVNASMGRIIATPTSDLLFHLMKELNNYCDYFEK